MSERSPVSHRSFRSTIRHSRIVALLLVAWALAACSTSELPIVGQAPTPNPASAGQFSPTTDENAMPAPTPARPATPAPPPTVAPVPTIESRLTTALDEEQ